VAITDKDKSKKFHDLVENTPFYHDNLPWSKDFELESSIIPHLTGVDVINYSGNFCPYGMNLPIYKEIIENHGFKNMSINNSLPSFTVTRLTFIDDKDKELLHSIGMTSYTMFIACKELLAHNSGKIFHKHGDEYNFPILEVENPLTGNLVEEW
jgi:dipeptidyl-peptidase-3